ncbi:MAG: hypothetical protein KDE14_05015, partial [Rhodobacteraceae bacterium]|nr:hypothetical protein [Paracoccaceae bacterium]
DGWASVSWNSDSVFNRNRARAGYDRRQMFQMGFVYELPMGKNMTGAGKAILGGWQISGIAAFLSGTPFTVGAPGADLNTPGELQTADQVGEVNKIGDVGSTGTWYNTNAFAAPTGVRFGTSGRNVLDTPGIRSLDLSLAKDIPLTEKVNAQLRVESYNFTNTPQFGTPSSNVANGDFMTVTGTSGSINQDRQFRLGLRFQF